MNQEALYNIFDFCKHVIMVEETIEPEKRATTAESLAFVRGARHAVSMTEAVLSFCQSYYPKPESGRAGDVRYHPADEENEEAERVAGVAGRAV